MTFRVSRLWTSIRDYFGSWSAGDKALSRIFGQGPSRAGINVTEENSLNVSAVWACVNLIAGNLASLPLDHYRRKPNGDRERATDTKLHRLLHDAPNEEMTSYQFRQTMQAHALLWGNAFAEIRRDQGGRIFDLTPIEPWRVQLRRRRGLAGPLFYFVFNRDGTMSELEPADMLHIIGLSANGVWGYSVVGKARESLGLTMAEEQTAAALYGNGMTVGGILIPKTPLNAEAREQLRNSLEQRHQGIDRAHKLMILPAEFSYEKMTMPGRDAQFLQQRAFQLSEIARWFGVPPHLIGDTEKVTSWGQGIQSQTIGFLEFTLRRWLVNWEQELNRKLISPLERNLQFFEFNVGGLERGDIETRYGAYDKGIKGGFMTPNEARAKENMPPLPGGDDLFMPVNMSTTEKIAEGTPAPTVQAPPPGDPDIAADDKEDMDRSIRVIQEGVDRLLQRPEPSAIDLAPVTERMDSLHAKVDGMPGAPPLGPVLEAIAEIKPATDGIHERIAELESKIDELPVPPAIEPVLDAIKALPAPPDHGDRIGALSDGLTDIRMNIASVAESVAALPVPPAIEPVLDAIKALPAPEKTDLAPVTRAIGEQELEIAALRGSVEAIRESVRAIPPPSTPEPVDLGPIQEQIAALPGAVGAPLFERLIAVEHTIARHRREIPTPSDSESDDDFIGRCMADEVMQNEFTDEDQRLAVCQQQLGGRALRRDMASLREDATRREEELAGQVKQLSDGTQALGETLRGLQGRLDSALEHGAVEKVRIVLAARAVLESQIRSVVRRECDRMKRAAISPEKLSRWAERFYAQQEDYAVKELRATVDLYSLAVGHQNGTEGIIRRHFGQAITEARISLASILTEPSETVPAAVEALVNRWEAERPAALADAIAQEVIGS